MPFDRARSQRCAEGMHSRIAGHVGRGSLIGTHGWLLGWLHALLLGWLHARLLGWLHARLLGWLQTPLR